MSDDEDAESSPAAMPIQHRILVVVLALQAGWLAYLCSRGWFYQDDFTYLSQAVHQHLTVGYLKQPINVHLAPGVRFLFWILAHTTRLHYGPTIAMRVALQALATILLFKLLTVVSQSRMLALAITVIYGVSPLLVPGTVYLGGSAQLLPAQICVLIVYLAHFRHGATGQLRWSAVAGLTMLVGVAFWEKTAVTALLLVIVSFGWLTTGALPKRVMGLIQDWRGWLLTLGPLAAFTTYYFSHNYESSTQSISVHAAAHLVWLQWGHSLWPSVIGAPWHWISSGETFISFAAPRLVTIILGQCAFGLLVIVGWRRNRWPGVLAWTLPLVSTVVGELLIAIGRYSTYGNLVGLQYDYVFDLAVPVALAAALALRNPAARSLGRAVAASARTTAPEPTAAEVRPRHRLRVVAGVGCVVLAVSSGVVSTIGWTNRWHENPAKTYVSTLLTSLRQIGPSANVFDTDVSLRVLPGISPDRNLSALLALTNAHVVFDQGETQPQLVNDSGQVVPATFLNVAEQAVARNRFCPSLVTGATNLTVRLKPRLGPNAYFLRIAYFEQRPALVTITVRDATGHVIAVRGNSTVDFDQPLGIVLLPLQQGQPRQVTFGSSSESASVCMSTVSIGEPVAAAPAAQPAAQP